MRPYRDVGADLTGTMRVWSGPWHLMMSAVGVVGGPAVPTDVVSGGCRFCRNVV